MNPTAEQEDILDVVYDEEGVYGDAVNTGHNF